MHAHPRVLLAPLVAAILIALTLAVAAPASAVVNYSDPAGKIIELTNKERASKGLSSLKRSKSLDAVAQAWAEELAAIYERALLKDPYAGVPLSHNPDTGKQIPSNWYAWGENVAWNRGYNDPVVKMNDQWIKSEHHHDNMVNTRYNYMGAGWYTDKFGVSWGVQVFGQYINTNPDANFTPPEPKRPPAVEVDPAKEGVDTISLNRGNRNLIKNHLGRGRADDVLSLGRSDDLVLAGDWNGDGADSIAIKRGNTYYVWNSLTTGDPWQTFKIGRAGDTPLVGDFNGDGKDTISIKRGSMYAVKYALGPGPSDMIFSMGKSDDVPLVGDFNGDGKDSISVKRGGKYAVKYALGTGPSNMIFSMGKTDDEALVGDFNGDGKDTISVKRGDLYAIKYRLGDVPSDQKFSIGKSSDTPIIADFDG